LPFQPDFRGFSLFFPCYQGISDLRPVRRDCVVHQVVRANRRDFLRHGIARHFRSLPRQGSVSVGSPAILRGNPWRVLPKVSGREFPFPRLLFATLPRPISNVGRSNLDTRPVRDGWISPSRKGKRAGTDRSLRRRLESERAPLVRPGHGKINETFETKPARQASFDCGLDDLRREESERQGHPD
jgi:hypothetical protein